jgi:hypothetical protein
MEMEQGSHEESMDADLAELRQLFGPPPVLRSETTQSYDEIMTRLMDRYISKSWRTARGRWRATPAIRP